MRRQLQPLDHREVGEQLVGQFFRRHAGTDRQRRRLDQFARLRRDRLHADQPTRAFLDHQFDEAAGIEVGERARHIVERERAAVGLDSLEVALGFGQPDRGDLRVGEDHGRHGGQIERRLAAGHVDRRARTARRRDVDELWMVGAIAGGVDVRGAGTQA
ncbi:hypothetical protein D9M68_845000 [compost metagenome]